uniref:Uncharacterized protein n=1 Tax=Peronospora matthiolae TaxID=2874970 RepID=A0AAV1VDR8_9STRA
MVRVSGSSGDSGFHRGFYDEDAKIKTEPGIGAPSKAVSPQMGEEKRF